MKTRLIIAGLFSVAAAAAVVYFKRNFVLEFNFQEPIIDPSTESDDPATFLVGCPRCTLPAEVVNISYTKNSQDGMWTKSYLLSCVSADHPALLVVDPVVVLSP